MPEEYEPIIGLEVHVQLRTASKLFCGCPVTFGRDPNSHICPVCAGFPGVLPSLNRKAVEHAVLAAVALGCRVSETSVFARKNYFYPDLPKGYQISQYESPLAENGALEFRVEDNVRRVAITRVHLEEEAGKLLHSSGGSKSWIDYNRAGIPLVEIVSEPAITSAEESTSFLRRLRQLLHYLGVSDVRMEEGSLRCDANLSLRPVGEARLGVKTELKNMNSFSAVEAALHCEINRQKELLKTGKEVTPETMLWNEDEKRVVVMRTKEEASDYRYFPEPDLPPLVVDSAQIEKIRDTMPELPAEKERRFKEQYRLSGYDTAILTSDPDVADYYEAVVEASGDARAASNWVMGEILGRLKSEGVSIKKLKVRPHDLAKILSLMADGMINARIAKEVVQEVADTGVSPEEIVGARDLSQITDIDRIGGLVDRIMAENEQLVEKYRGGKGEVLGFFIGQVMKETDGRASPSIVNEILREKLNRNKSPGRGLN